MHVHGHGDQRAGTILRISLVLTVAYIVLLVVAGLRAHSLALLSEAGHNVSDFLALLLSWIAVYLQGRPPNASKTYGYHRAGVIAAFINATSLVVISLLIFYEAYQRFLHPEPVQPKIMMWVAAAGVALNGAISLMLMRNRGDINLRSALIHEIGDTLSTAAVIVGGWIIILTGKVIVDPILSTAIGVMILWSSFGIIRESLNILLEGTPRGVKVDEIVAEVKSVRGVNDVHDLHVWSIGSDTHALSAHVAIADIPPSESDSIMCDIRERLLERFHIHHTTIQFESADCDGCSMPLHQPHHHHGHVH